MIDTEYGLDEKIEESEMRLFSKSEPIKSSEVQGLKSKLKVEQVIDQETGRSRNKVNFDDDENDIVDEGSDNSENDESDVESENENERDDSDENEDSEVDENDRVNIKSDEVKLKPQPSLQDSVLAKKDHPVKLKDKNKILLKEMGDDENSSSNEESENEALISTKSPDSSGDSGDDIEGNKSNISITNKSEGIKPTQKKKNTSYHPEVTQRINDVLSILKKNDKPQVGHENDSGHESSDSESDRESDPESNEDESESEDEEYSETAENSRDIQSEDQFDLPDTHWKADLARKASEAFYNRQSSSVSLKKLVYGMSTNEALNLGDNDDENAKKDHDEMEELGGMFKVMKQNQFRKDDQRLAMDQLDNTRFSSVNVQDWDDEDIRLKI